MNSLPQNTAPTTDLDERDWSLSTKGGWFAMASAPPRIRPPMHSLDEIAAMSRVARSRYNQARALWHANLGPIRTPGIDTVFDALDEICGANRQDGGKVKPAAVLDALPGLGKTTAATAFGRTFHIEQIELHGPLVPASDGQWQRVPVVYIGLTSNTTIRSLSAMLCRFYGLPGADSGNALRLSHRAAECVANCKSRLIIVDDVHFLDVNRRDGREVANHFKWLANTFPVTFFFVGVGLRARGLLDEGLSGADAAFSQTARRWNVLTLQPFEVATEQGRRTWHSLLLGIEREIVLAEHHRGVLAEELSDYLFARSTGHFASLMSLLARGCYRAAKTSAEQLSVALLDEVRIDEAAEKARRSLHAAISAGQLRTRPHPVAELVGAGAS
jgi:AAA domain